MSYFSGVQMVRSCGSVDSLAHQGTSLANGRSETPLGPSVSREGSPGRGVAREEGGPLVRAGGIRFNGSASAAGSAAGDAFSLPSPPIMLSNFMVQQARSAAERGPQMPDLTLDATDERFRRIERLFQTVLEQNRGLGDTLGLYQRELEALQLKVEQQAKQIEALMKQSHKC